MTTEQENQPISHLDERLDDLLCALGRVPNLDRYAAGMRAYEELMADIGPDTPGAVDILAGVEIRRALINVMDEVLVLKRKGADDGRS